MSTPAGRACAGLGSDEPREECGIFGIWAPGLEVARITYFGLKALQHRGQESAGMAVSSGQSVLVRKDLGLVGEAFSEFDLRALSGRAAIGHVRYATSGARNWEAAQPHFFSEGGVTIALAHNGTLVNASEVRRELESEGFRFQTSSDSETATVLVGQAALQSGSLLEGVRSLMRRLEGGYAMVLANTNAICAFRDPHGIRPLVLGSLGVNWVVASETCALEVVGARFVREIRPGEIVTISDEGITCQQGIPARADARCIFEHVYFSRPDSTEQGRSMYAMRFDMGRQLAREAPVDVDLVFGVPDSGLPPAEGYAAELGLRYGEGLLKNRYVARTFIEPTQEMRELGVRMKLTVLSDSIRDKRVVMVDDSIVRGTTMRQLVQMLKESGCSEVHVRIMCPEVRWPCFYGIDTDDQSELISAKSTSEEIRSFIGADSLAFLSLEGLLASVPPGGYCTACYTGHYPVQVPHEAYAGHFLVSSHPSFDE